MKRLFATPSNSRNGQFVIIPSEDLVDPADSPKQVATVRRNLATTQMLSVLRFFAIVICLSAGAMLSAFFWESTAEGSERNAFFEHCVRSSLSADMDCRCVAARESELRVWASEKHATGNAAAQIAIDQWLIEIRKERLSSEIRPAKREALQNGIAALEERLALISAPLDPSVHQYRTLYTYFDDNLECRNGV